MLPLLAGTVLSFLGVLTLSSLGGVAIQRGFFLRAALICAIIKSISPSVVVFQPMIGITLEGALIEIGVLILGANLLGLAVGGGLALVSIPLFKAVRLYIMYGESIWQFFSDILKFLPQSNNISYGSILVVLILAIYFLLGLLAVYIGFGLRARNFNLPNIDFIIFENKAGAYSAIKFVYPLLHLALLIIYLSIAAEVPKTVSIAMALAYVFVCLIIYEKPRRMMQKPKVMLPLLIFSFVLPFITSPIHNVIGQGFYIFSRALLVIVSLSAIGIELSRPEIKFFFSSGVFNRLYLAVNMAFNALPIYLDVLNSNGKALNAGVKNVIHDMLGSSKWHGPRPVIIITGGLGEGKTSFTEEVVANMLINNLKLCGFLAKGVGEPPLRQGYKLKLIPDGMEKMLCKRIGACGLPHRSFEFDQNVIDSLTEKFLKLEPEDVLVIDEVGRMELFGEVWSRLIEHHLKVTSNPLIISVRRENIMLVAERLGLENAYVIDIKNFKPFDAALEIQGLILNYFATRYIKQKS